jgi:3-methylcrotonyl-CoA carboxylase alpha subunit
VVIKAVSGGGGRGMRVVEAAADFDNALREARQEALSAFGDDRVLIERYLQRPRHIEVQVFADTHGNVVHLFERDCSVQRRHQKVIEEAPAPGIDPRRRIAMGEAAIAAARAVGYVGAGTVEFVADADGFFFLEMNTRLQVEHPVTEMVTGFDLVEWQLRVAAGEMLPATQEEIRLSGHAIEARLYAEDPARDFAPSIGRLVAFRLPSGENSVRVDAGFVTGGTVSIHYDAMLAKLIVHGATREVALATLRGALADCDIVGVASNLDLLYRIAAHPAFAAGGVDTGFIGRYADTLLAAQDALPEEVLAAAALCVLTEEAETAARQAAAGMDPYSPWHARDQWWVNAAPDRVLEFHGGESIFPVTVRRDGEAWLLTIGARTLRAAAKRGTDGWLEMTLGDARSRVRVSHDGETVTVRRDGATFRFGLPDPIAHAEEADTSDGRLVAPLPGQVTQVLAKPGGAVKRGQVLVVLEAMKTVFRLTAPADGVVEHVSCQVGETVQESQVLVSFAD